MWATPKQRETALTTPTPSAPPQTTHLAYTGVIQAPIASAPPHTAQFAFPASTSTTFASTLPPAEPDSYSATALMAPTAVSASSTSTSTSTSALRDIPTAAHYAPRTHLPSAADTFSTSHTALAASTVASRDIPTAAPRMPLASTDTRSTHQFASQARVATDGLMQQGTFAGHSPVSRQANTPVVYDRVPPRPPMQPVETYRTVANIQFPTLIIPIGRTERYFATAEFPKYYQSQVVIIDGKKPKDATHGPGYAFYLHLCHQYQPNREEASTRPKGLLGRPTTVVYISYEQMTKFFNDDAKKAIKHADLCYIFATGKNAFDIQKTIDGVVKSQQASGAKKRKFILMNIAYAVSATVTNPGTHTVRVTFDDEFDDTTFKSAAYHTPLSLTNFDPDKAWGALELAVNVHYHQKWTEADPDSMFPQLAADYPTILYKK